MSAIYIVCFLALTVGIVLVLGLTPEQLTRDLAGLFQRRKSLREQSLNARGKKKSRRITVAMQNIRTALEETGKGKQFSVALAASGLLVVVGCAVAIAIGNPFLIPVLAVAFAMIPFAYLRRTLDTYERHVKAELETALSIITTAYLRSEDILTSVEENLEYLNPPVKTVFADFVSRIRLIDPDLEAALEELKGKIENDVFMEWVDALKSCLYDRSLKTTLTPIVAKLSDMRIVNAELEYLVFEPRKEFITMVVLAVGNIPLLYFLNQSWYDTLMHTIPGQIMLAVTGAIIFVSTACVIKLTKPIEYRT